MTEVSDETLLAALRDLYAELGRQPTCQEFDDRTPHSDATVRRHFGSWRAAIEAAGYDYERQKGYSRETVLEALVDYDNRVDGRPTLEGFKADGSLSEGPVIRVFGSWASALDALGYEELPANAGAGRGETCPFCEREVPMLPTHLPDCEAADGGGLA